MKKTLPNVMLFPVDAQSSNLFCSLSSVFMYLDHIQEDTPFFCGRFHRSCVNCGKCGKKTNMPKHHLQIYQHYITISGVAYLWEDKAIGDDFAMSFSKELFSPKALDRLDFTMQAAGFHYERMTPADEKIVVFNRIKQAIDDDVPILIQYGGGGCWGIINGYDESDYAISFIKLNQPPVMQRNWYEKFVSMVFIKDRIPVLDYAFLLSHMIKYLESKSIAKLEQKVINGIDTSEDNYKLALWLNKLAGYSVENRWHASECYQTTLYRRTEDVRMREILCEAARYHLEFHDQAWKVWGVLGVGPESGYAVPKNVGQHLDRNSMNELKRLFGVLFSLDNNVLQCLKAYEALLS